MAEKTVGGKTYYINDELRKRFESLADTASGPVGPQAQHELIDSCVDANGEPDYDMRLSLVEWLYIWREMSPKTAPETVSMVERDKLIELANNAGTLRKHRNPIANMRQTRMTLR